MKELKQTNMNRGGVLYTRKVKAFTLIELLAVIVILAIIAVIATPIILGIINDSKYKAFKISLNNIEHAYELYAVQKNIKPGTEIDISKLPLDSKNLSGKVFLNSDGKIELKEVTDGTYSAEGTLDDLSVLKGTIDELVKNKLKIDVNLNSTSTSIIVTVDRIEGYPTSYSYEITGPNDYSEKVNNKQENTHTFDKLKIDKEYTIKVTAKNKIGLTKEVTKTIKTLKTESSIDIKLSPDDEYIKEGTVTIKYTIKEEGLVGKYKWNEEEEFTPANQNTIEISAKNGTLTAVLMDGEEIVLSKSLAINNIDNENPIITKIDVSGTSISNVIAKVTASDEGISNIDEYSCDGTWQSSNTCNFTTIGNHTIRVKDKAGNESEEKTIIYVETPPSDTLGLKKVVYYNPVTGNYCNKTNAVSNTETKSGCMKWYAYLEDSTSYTMILDHNTTAVGTPYNSSNDNTVCKEACDKLNDDTSKWNSSILEKRFITADEIALSTGHTNFKASDALYTDWFYFDSGIDSPQKQVANLTNKSKYYWLYDYTNGCASYGCKIEDSNNKVLGYWTSPQLTTKHSVWHINFQGFLGNPEANTSDRGIRPVIKINK